MGKTTISMAIFNSYVSHYQRVIWTWWTNIGDDSSRWSEFSPFRQSIRSIQIKQDSKPPSPGIGTIPPVGTTRLKDPPSIPWWFHDDSIIFHGFSFSNHRSMESSWIHSMVIVHRFYIDLFPFSSHFPAMSLSCHCHSMCAGPGAEFNRSEAIGQESLARGSQQFDLDFHRGRDENWAQDGGENLFIFFSDTNI